MRAIAQKDFRASRRDARILVLLLLPLVLALALRGSTGGDRPQVTIAIAGADASLTPALQQAAGDSARLTLTPVGARQAAALVRAGDADIALIAGPGFDDDLRAGRDPELTVIVPAAVTSASGLAQALVDPTLRQLAGQQLPARVSVHAVDSSNHDPIDRIGSDRFKLLLVVVYLIANVALILVPTLVAEEHEQGTLDALLMVGSPLDVGAAKALVGVAAVSTMVVLTVNLGDIAPADNGLFAAGVLLLAVVLIGFGLLIGAVLRTTARVNTWMGLLILPVIAPAALLGLSLPGALRIALSLTPTAEATRLMANGLSGETIYSQPALSALGLLLWGAIAYGLLVRTLARREA